MESCFAIWMPADALVAPGPRVTKQMPGRPVSLADRFRHHRGAALLAADGHRDVAVVERVERREIAFARHAEHMVHAVDDQLVDQDFAAGAGAVIAAHQFAPRRYRLGNVLASGSAVKRSRDHQQVRCETRFPALAFSARKIFQSGSCAISARLASRSAALA